MWLASLTPITLIMAGIIIALFLVAGAIAWVANNWNTIWAGMGVIMGGFLNWCGEVLGGFANWWNEMWGGLGNWIKQVWDGFISWIKQVWDGFMVWIGIVLGGFVNWWNELWGGFGNWTKEIWDGFIAGIQNLWNGFTAWLVAAVTWIFTAWVAGWTQIGNFFSGIWNGIVGFAAGAWQRIVQGVQGGIQNVLGFFSQLGPNIAGFIGGIVDDAWSWGTNIIDGLLGGLRSMAGDIGSFFLSLLPGWIVEPFKAALGIHSPSRVFYEMGEHTGDGYLNGAESKKSLIKKSMESLVAIPEQPRTSTTLAYAIPAGAGTGDTYNIHPAQGMDEVLLGQHISNNNRRSGRR
jgi:hypothetical protein